MRVDSNTPPNDTTAFSTKYMLLCHMYWIKYTISVIV